jgi:O-antigen ligase
MVLVLFAVSVIPEGFNYVTTGMPTEGDLVSRTVYLSLLALGCYLVFRHRLQVRRLIAAANKPFLVFVALASASIIWSIAPDITFKRLFRLYLIVLVCVAFVTVGWKPGQFQRVLRMAFFLLCASSVVFCLVNPELGIHSNPNIPEIYGGWHGITTGKNVLGSLAGCSFIVWLHAYRTRESSRFFALVNMGLAGVCLVMSHSSTSLMSTVFAALVALLLLYSPGPMRRYLPYMVGVLAVTVLLYAMAVLRIVPGLDALLQPITWVTGKDLTFTGRTNIWYILKLHIQQSPLLGSGFGAYWVGPDPASPSYQMISQLYFYPTEGHNGYLDVINDLGYVGACVLFAYFASYLRQAVSLLRIDRATGALYLTLIFRGFLADMSESHWFFVLNVDFMLFTLATFSLSRELLHAKAAGSAARAPAAGRRPVRPWLAAHPGINSPVR